MVLTEAERRELKEKRRKRVKEVKENDVAYKISCTDSTTTVDMRAAGSKVKDKNTIKIASEEAKDKSKLLNEVSWLKPYMGAGGGSKSYNDTVHDRADLILAAWACRHQFLYSAVASLTVKQVESLKPSSALLEKNRAIWKSQVAHWEAMHSEHQYRDDPATMKEFQKMLKIEDEVLKRIVVSSPMAGVVGMDVDSG